MKKLLLPVLFASFLANAQTTVFTENFEDITDLQDAGWTLYNDSNIPYGSYATAFPDAWRIISWTNESGNKVASSPSWFTTITPADRWLITPAITIPANFTVSLEYFARSHDDSPYDDGFKLKISTTTKDKSAFSNIQTVDHAVNSSIVSLEPYTVDLSSYVGKTVYLAWVNDYTNGNLLSIDDIIISATSLGVSDVKKKNLSLYPNPTKDYFQLSDSRGKINVVKIYDISGILVKEMKVQNSGKYNVSDLKTGVYNVSVESTKSTQNIKLIKK